MQTILDFHIRIESQSSYQLEIFRRDQSQPLASARFDFPLSFMTEFELRQLEPDHKDPAGRVERLRRFGAKLYDKLFNAEVRRVWREQKRSTDFLTLCLRIAPDARGLEALPWETLFDGEEFIAAGVKTGVSRLPLDAHPQDDLPAIPPKDGGGLLLEDAEGNSRATSVSEVLGTLQKARTRCGSR